MRGQRQNRRPDPLAGDTERGGAGRGPRDHRLQLQRLRHVARGDRDRIGSRRLGRGALRADDRAVQRVRLHLDGDAIHEGNGFDRVFSDRAFRRKHDRVGALEDRLRDVRYLGARRHRRIDHRFQHLRGDDDGLALASCAARDALLNAGHLFQRQFDAEIAARDHQAVRERDDLVEPGQRLRFLDLRHDQRAAIDDRLDLGDVFRTLHEGRRDPIDAEFQGGLEIGMVLGRHRRNRDLGIRQADAFAVRDRAADVDDRDRVSGIGFDDV